MKHVKRTFTLDDLKYLKLLAEQYPSVQQVCTEIINLRAVMNLPKATEHFMSDLHGEYAAFYHILNNCSGVIREKVANLFRETMGGQEQSDFCTLIYYPENKLGMVKAEGLDTEEWYRDTLYDLIELCKIVSSKYTRQKVREALPPEYGYIIDELLHAQDDEDDNQLVYHQEIIDTIIRIDNADEFIIALSTLIKRLAVDRLHIVGDIFDRGPRADSIIDMLMEYHSVDIEWGNHDILWMGAATGSSACIATVIKNTVSYNNLQTLENGYGISLRPLSIFASETYPQMKEADALKKCISIILFKLEGQLIKRHPEYDMKDRLLLDKIDYITSTVTIDGKEYPMEDMNFPTIQPDNPYALSDGEVKVMRELRKAFRESERLHRHARFLYERGSMYLCYNQNLLYHGCIPLDDDGSLLTVYFDGECLQGKSYMDYCEKKARRAYFSELGRQEKQDCRDFMWYLWCGKLSPLYGRAKMTSFERLFVKDKSTWEEPKNPYYTHYHSEDVCRRILLDFDLTSDISHIINGHVPVKAVEGENPVKANGKLIVIDGGFCRAYQETTGIAGYTLIYNSHGLRIMSHEPFLDTEKAILENKDIRSQSNMFETETHRVMVRDTDYGDKLTGEIQDLEMLLAAYRQGVLAPKLTDQELMKTWYPEDESDFMQQIKSIK